MYFAHSQFTLTVLNMCNLLNCDFQHQLHAGIHSEVGGRAVQQSWSLCPHFQCSLCYVAHLRRLKKKSVWLWAKQLSLPSSFFGSFSTAELLKQGNGQETNRASRLNRNVSNCVVKNWISYISSKFTGRVSIAGEAMSEWVLMTAHHYFEPRRSWKRW